MANFIEMPKLSDTMTTGTLVKWLKKEGDKVATGDMLAEVETDKATMELECFFDGVLLKIFMPAGSNVPIGAPLCAVGQPGEKVEAPAGAGAPVQTGTSGSGQRPGQGEETPQQGRPEAGGGKPGQAAGGAQGSGAIGSGAQQGQGSAAGNRNANVSSAGAGGQAGGQGGAGRVQGSGGSGSEAQQGQGSAAGNRNSNVSSAGAGGQAGGSGAEAGGSGEDLGSGAEGGRIRISPLARKLAAEKRIDPALVKGSGPSGRITRVDILAAEKAGLAGKTASAGRATGGGNGAKAGSFAGAAPSRTGPVQEEKLTPVSNMRATIARRLVESKTQIPHFYLDIEVDAAPLLELRSQLNTALEAEGVKLSVNDFILKASVDALRRVPAVNCSWADPGTGQPAIRQHAAAHVSFAVAIEDGLITPVIKDAHTKNLFAISTEAKSLARLAKDRKLQPAQFTGGTFCVSNLGMMGIDRFNAIINPPNAAILAVGTTVKKPVVKGDQIVIGQRMNLTLSVDHRVVDGAVGATFLAALKELLERPALLLL